MIALLIFAVVALISMGYAAVSKTRDWSSRAEHVGAWVLFVGIPWGCLIKFLVR